jgi:hypothetical protein
MTTKRPALRRDDILVIDDRPLYELDVPEWNGVIYIRALSARERDRFEQYVQSTKSDGHSNGNGVTPDISIAGVRERLCVLCCADENGERLFTEDDIVWLGERSGAVLDRIATAAIHYNGMSKEAQDALKASFLPTPAAA